VHSDRLKAFSEGVMAVALTIMVLDLKAPAAPDFSALAALWPGFLSYAASFLYVAIYWNNHHHLLHTVTRVDGLILWANMHLLFWVTLIPFATAWIGPNGAAAAPTATYGVALFMPALAYFLLQKAIIRSQGAGSILSRALGGDYKGLASPVLYAAGVALAFVRPWASDILYALIALIWLVPDRRIERLVEES
jgi:uncharacterized membrane protein